MTKKQLYLVIALLCVTLLYVLFMPAAVTNAPEQTDVPIDSAVPEEASNDVVETVTEATEEEASDIDPESIMLEGTFVGLLDGENVYKKKFKYMLLNDGMEVLRIDLRPLVGYSDLNIIDKLGVDRGDDIKVTGVMYEGEFKIESVK